MIIMKESEFRIYVDPIEEVLEAARSGRPYMLIDDENRENEGDIIIPAQFATPEIIAFMAKQASGLICLTLTQAQAGRLGLIRANELSKDCLNQTAFTQSIEATHGITTGISAHDRAQTIREAIAEGSDPSRISSPGHMFPLIARDGGVLERPGHTEASVDISRICGLNPSGVICEIMLDDGRMARLPELRQWADRFGLPLGTIQDLITWRLDHQTLVSQGGNPSQQDGWTRIAFVGPCNEDHCLSIHGAEPDGARPLWIAPMGAGRTLRQTMPRGSVIIEMTPGTAMDEAGRIHQAGYVMAAQMLRHAGIGAIGNSGRDEWAVALSQLGIGVEFQPHNEITD